tara:strand:- start:5692 stop:6279 length:588 start_codon:yes stop_codon:yes gene_type:complete
LRDWGLSEDHLGSVKQIGETGMKKKTKQVEAFIQGMHEFVTKHPQFRKKTAGKSETQIQAEIRPILVSYLEKYFQEKGYKDYVAKANAAFYWEGQEGIYGRQRKTTFGARNYPDFIITAPYLVAIEYKQSPNGSLVKQGLGQSMIHTLCDEYDFVYYLFHDQSKDKRIEKSLKNSLESTMIERAWKDFNVMMRFV